MQKEALTSKDYWQINGVYEVRMNRKKARPLFIVTICMLGVAFLLNQPAGAMPVRVDQDRSVQKIENLTPLPNIAGCNIYPSNNIWNTPVDTLPVDSHSDAWINTIGRSTTFHMDFGPGTYDGGLIGIPYNLVNGSVPKVSVSFYTPTESDAGPYSSTCTL